LKRKFVAATVVFGIVICTRFILAVLGIEGAFGYEVSCGPGAITCIRVYAADEYASIRGIMVAILGVLGMISAFGVSHRDEKHSTSSA
jgi:hypothetical protein